MFNQVQTPGAHAAKGPLNPERKKTMKNSLLVAALVALAVSACGKKEEPVAVQPAPTAQEQMKESAAQAVEAAKESAKAAGDGGRSGHRGRSGRVHWCGSG